MKLYRKDSKPRPLPLVPRPASQPCVCCTVVDLGLSPTAIVRRAAVTCMASFGLSSVEAVLRHRGLSSAEYFTRLITTECDDQIGQAATELCSEGGWPWIHELQHRHPQEWECWSRKYYIRRGQHQWRFKIVALAIAGSRNKRVYLPSICLGMVSGHEPVAW